MREIKLAATLKHLIEAGDYNGNRKQLSIDLGITTAALSQYLKGQNNPSVDKLVAIAELFGVSLDYLMFGEDSIARASGTLDYGPLARYMEASLASARADAAVQSAFVSKIGAILAERIGVAAKDAAQRPVTFAGMLDNSQARELEQFSLESYVAAMDLDEDLVEIEGSIEQGVAAGNFLTVVAENLRKKRGYHFVLSPEMPDREYYVQQFQTLLDQHGLSRSEINRCKFTDALESFYAGFCLFKLDVAQLRKLSPILYQYVEEYLGNDGWIGFTESPNSNYVGVSLMDHRHRALASATWNRLVAKTKKGTGE